MGVRFLASVLVIAAAVALLLYCLWLAWAQIGEHQAGEPNCEVAATDMYYINLDSARERVPNIEEALLRFSCGRKDLVHRVAAIRKGQGHKGCGLSHALALNRIHESTVAAAKGYGMVFEDDASLVVDPAVARARLAEAMREIEGRGEKWDVLYLFKGGAEYQTTGQAGRASVRLVRSTRAQAYVVRHGYAKQLADFYERASNKFSDEKVPGEKPSRMAIDRVCVKLMAKDKWYRVLPAEGDGDLFEQLSVNPNSPVNSSTS